jgi:WhiB family redox-sensing transcriptional regulator
MSGAPSKATLDIPYPAFDGTQACLDESPELFFPRSESGAMDLETKRAVAVCRSCPFQRACLAYAIAVDVHGIWGGVTRSERVRIRQELGIRAHAPTTADLEQTHHEIALMERGGHQRVRSPMPSASPRDPSSGSAPEHERTRQHDHH